MSLLRNINYTNAILCDSVRCSTHLHNMPHPGGIYKRRLCEIFRQVAYAAALSKMSARMSVPYCR